MMNITCESVGITKNGQNFMFNVVVEDLGISKGWTIRKGWIWPPSFRAGKGYYSTWIKLNEVFIGNLYDFIFSQLAEPGWKDVMKAGGLDANKEQATRPLRYAI